MKTTKRMDKPDDTLAKRQAAYAGDVIHEYFKFPGRYFGPCINEYPDNKGSVKRVDSSYLCEINNQIFVLNREDESAKVDEKTLEKVNTYRILLTIANQTDVISTITTTVPKKKCLDGLEISPTLTLNPLIVSLVECDGKKTLNRIRKKVKNNHVLDNVEAMNLIMIPKMFTENQEQITEEACRLLKDSNIENQSFKYELTLEMQCIIHKYAKTVKKINELEKVIKLQKAMTAMEYQYQKIRQEGIREGRDKGIKEGRDKGIIDGKFELAIKIKHDLGIEKALELTNFTKEELEKEELNS